MNIKLAAAILLPVCYAIASVQAAEPNTLTPEQKAAGWQLLFDGKTLEGWKASDQPGTFSVQDGAILVHGPRSHLYYLGDVGHRLRRDRLGWILSLHQAGRRRLRVLDRGNVENCIVCSHRTHRAGGTRCPHH